MSLIHTYLPQLRWSDQDLNGHVNNARILTLLEDSRITFLQKAPAGVMAGDKVVGRIEIDYRKPVMYGSDLRIDSWVTRVGNTSYTIQSAALQDGAVVFESQVVLVLLDEAGRPRKLNANDRAFLHKYTSAAD